jgi:Zonular occludens toxin (Zot)
MLSHLLRFINQCLVAHGNRNHLKSNQPDRRKQRTKKLTNAPNGSGNAGVTTRRMPKCEATYVIGAEIPIEIALARLEKKTKQDPRLDTECLKKIQETQAKPSATIRLTDDDIRAHGAIFGATGGGKSSILKQLYEERMRAGEPHVYVVHNANELTQAVSIFSLVYDLETVEAQGNLFVIDLESDQWVVPNDVSQGGNDPESLGIRLQDEIESMVDGESGPIVNRGLRACLQGITHTHLTLGQALDLFDSPTLRAQILPQLPQFTRAFWEEYESLSITQQRTFSAPIRNRLESLLAYTPIRNMFSVPKRIDWARFFKDIPNLVVIVNTGVDRFGSIGVLAGLFILESITDGLMTSERDTNREVKTVLVLLDEAQRFFNGTKSSSRMINRLENLLNTSRKFGISVFMVSQLADNFPNELKNVILTNAHLKMFFICSTDASLFADNIFLQDQEITKEQKKAYLTQQKTREAALSIGGKESLFLRVSDPSPYRGVPKITVAALIEASHHRYAMRKEEVEAIIEKRRQYTPEAPYVSPAAGPKRRIDAPERAVETIPEEYVVRREESIVRRTERPKVQKRASLPSPQEEEDV